jgi:hypothetical protein
MRDRENKPTVFMCYRTGCENKPMWNVKNIATNKIVKCCDEHLATTIRVSGLPCKIDAFEEDATGVHKLPPIPKK